MTARQSNDGLPALRLSSAAPLDVSIAKAEAWFDQNSAKRRADLERGLRHEGFDEEAVTESLMLFDEQDRDCKAEWLNLVLDSLAALRRGEIPKPN